MNEREIECSRCDNTTIMIQDDIPSGWVFVESGWADIGNMRLCPECKAYYLKHRAVVGKHARMYPDLIMYPSE